jgi:hypothetical protein
LAPAVVVVGGFAKLDGNGMAVRKYMDLMILGGGGGI